MDEWVVVGDDKPKAVPATTQFAKDKTSPVTQIAFTLNGETRTVVNPDPEMLLVDYLRRVENMTGTKKSCGEGGCGACVILVGDSPSTQVPVNSCLRLLCSVNGQCVTTIEGVGNATKGYHEVQRKLADCNGSQCGFCSPGMVMSMVGLLNSSPSSPTTTQIESQFDGNICRCTGYRPILDAMQSFANSTDQQKICSKNCVDMEDMCGAPTKRILRRLGGGEVTWYAPTSINETMALMGSLGDSSNYRLVAANTGTQGVLKYYNGKSYKKPVAVPPNFIDIRHIPDLHQATVTPSGAIVGACVTISELIDLLQHNASVSTTFSGLAKHMSRIASHPVRNAGSVGGNVMMYHQYNNFASDMMLLLAAVRCLFYVQDPASSSTVVLSAADFQTTSMDGKLLVAILLPAYSDLNFRSFKIMLRHQNTHAIVNAAFGISFQPQTKTVKDVTIFYGGISPKGIVHATATEAALKGNDITQQSVLSNVLATVNHEVVADPAMGRTAYRQNLVTSLLYKFILSLQPSIPAALQSAAFDFERPISSGTWTINNAEDPTEFPVSEPVNKIEALLQTSGQARYTDDNPTSTAHLFGAFVLSSKANAAIQAVNTDKALASNGAVTYIDAAAVAKAGFQNAFMTEPLFVSDRVEHVGDRIGLILADTQAHADFAATLVEVTYTDEQPVIVDLDSSIAAKDFYTKDPQQYTNLVVGDAQKALDSADVVVQGSASCGHQYHFHMETQTADAQIGDQGRVQVMCAMQAPQLLQQAIAGVLNKQLTNVEVSMDRAGGGFGGKITRSFPVAVAAAVATCIANAPVRIVLDLNTNMTMLGSRRPHRLDFKVGCSKDGHITAVTGNVYNLQGARTDLGMWDAIPVHDAIDNAYNIPNWAVYGFGCKSNTPGNTACRGPGFLPGAFLMESVIDAVADALKMTPEQVREINMYQKNDVTPQGQTLAYCTQQDTYNLAKESSGFTQLQQSVADFNSKNTYVKQGVACVPTKYFMPASFGYAATVVVNDDATVKIFQSGCEIGQGLNTKVAQMAAYTLRTVMTNISVAGVDSTYSTSITGGSITSEGCCASVRLACEELLKKMGLVRAELRGRLSRDPTWEELVAEATKQGVNKQASATYNGQGEPGLPGPSKSGPFQYVSYGAAVAHVQIDVLTGEVQILRSDVVLDCGISLNAALDAGQMQGAFAMGVGYVLTEEFLWDADGSATGDAGANMSNGTWEYKPPTTTDIPIEFNITMLPHAPNPMGVLSSKATGEPSILAALSVLSALRHAVSAFTTTDHSLASKTTNKLALTQGKFRDAQVLNAPATVEATQMACHVDYTKFSLTA